MKYFCDGESSVLALKEMVTKFEYIILEDVHLLKAELADMVDLLWKTNLLCQI